MGVDSLLEFQISCFEFVMSKQKKIYFPYGRLLESIIRLGLLKFEQQ